MDLPGMFHGYGFVATAVDYQDVGHGFEYGGEVEGQGFGQQGNVSGMTLIVANVGVLDGGTVQRGGVSDKSRDPIAGCMGQYHRAAEAATEKGGQGANRGMLLQGFDRSAQVAAARLEGCDFAEIPLAFSATTMVKTEIRHTMGIAGPGQGNLLDGIAVGQQTVASDDQGWERDIG